MIEIFKTIIWGCVAVVAICLMISLVLFLLDDILYKWDDFKGWFK